MSADDTNVSSSRGGDTSHRAAVDAQRGREVASARVGRHTLPTGHADPAAAGRVNLETPRPQGER